MATTLLLTLLTTLIIARGDMLQQWRTQFPPETPNYFLINIQPWEKAPLDQLFADEGLSPVLYPMIRGRISSLNGTPLAEAPLSAEQRGHNALRRELNLTWAAQMPDNNTLLSGSWWQDTPSEPLISVEQELAEALPLDRPNFPQTGAHPKQVRS